MKRAGTEMPARNSYSWVRASSPRWISAAEAVVPPMSKATRSASPIACPSRSAPTAPAARPEEMKKTGFARATAAALKPAVGVADEERRRDARAREAASSSRAR